jgi:hypothetical protein
VASTTSQDPHDRRVELGKLLEARRGELGYESRPAFEKGTGLNTRLAADVEKGYRDNFKPDTIGRIARAYQVTPASIARYLDGHGEGLENAVTLPPAARGELPAWMTEDEKYRLGHFADEIWMRLVARGENASGADLFGEGTPDARTWDAFRARRAWSLPEMVGMLADVHYREAGGGNANTGSA